MLRFIVYSLVVSIIPIAINLVHANDKLDKQENLENDIEESNAKNIGSVEVKGIIPLACVWYLCSFLSVLFIALGHRDYEVDNNLLKYLSSFFPQIIC